MSGLIKSKLKTTLYYSSLALLLGFFSLAAGLDKAAAASTPSFSVSPASGTYSVGDYVTVSVSEDSGSQAVNAVEADLLYDKNVLSFDSLDGSQSPFKLEGTMSAGGGVVKIPRAIAKTSLTDSKLVSKVTFKVIAPAKGSLLKFDTTSQILLLSSHADIWQNGTQNGASFNLVSSTSGSSGGSGSSGSSSSGSSSSNGSKTGTGGSKSSGGSGSSSSAGGSTSPPANNTSVPQTGTPGDTSMPQTLLPTTHSLAIKILDTEGKPVSGATVKIDSQTTTSDSDGVASFTGVSEGQHQVSVTYSGKTESKPINVKATDSVASIQQFKVKLSSKSKAMPVWIIYLIIGLIVLFGLGFIIPRRRPKFSSFADPDATNVITGNASAKAGPSSIHPYTSPDLPKPSEQIRPTNGNGQDNINKEPPQV
jgi:hypothetical protein